MEYKLFVEVEVFFFIDNGGYLIVKKVFIDSVLGKRVIELLLIIVFNVEVVDNVKFLNKVIILVWLVFVNYKLGYDFVVVMVLENVCVGKIFIEIFKYILGGMFLILFLESLFFIVDENGIVKFLWGFDFEI